MKKIISGFLAVCSLVTCFSNAAVVNAAANEKNDAEEYTATAVFGKKSVLTNLTATPSGNYELSYSNNREVYKLTSLTEITLIPF